MNIVLSRQNEMAQEVLGEGSACWLVTRMAVFGESSNLPPEPQATLDLTGQELQFVRRVPNSEDPDSAGDYWDVFATVVVWSKGTWDHVLRLIAMFQETCFWMSCDTGSIFAPYDGGIDIIMPDKARLAALKTRHADWLAP